MKVLVLDDDKHRLKIFKNKLSDEHDVETTMTSDETIKKLNRKDYDYIFLDHDLGGKQMEWEDDNCGMNVVDWMIKNNKQKKAIIHVHSYNIPRGKEMYQRLKEKGYKVYHSPGAWKNLK